MFFKLQTFTALQCIRIFYFLGLIVMLERIESYTYLDYSSVVSTDMYLYKWIPGETNINQILTFLGPCLMAVFVLLAPFVSYQWVRGLWAFLFYLVEGFSFSYVLGHQIHMYVWIFLFFALIPGHFDDKKGEGFYFPFVRAAQIQILLIYALSGYWKGRAFIESFWDSNIVAGFDYVPYAAAWELLNSNKSYEASRWIMTQPALCLLLATLVLFAQCGSMVVIFFPRFYFFWGLILSLFHVGTLLTVNVFFSWSVYPIMLFLCFYRNSDNRTFRLLL